MRARNLIFMSFQFLQTSMGTLRLCWSEGLLGRMEFIESNEVNSTLEDPFGRVLRSSPVFHLVQHFKREFGG